MKFWSALQERHVDIDKSLIIRSHVYVPGQSEPVPCLSEELYDPISEFHRIVESDPNLSDEFKAKMRRLYGERRKMIEDRRKEKREEKGRRKSDKENENE